jgi:histidine triad (HIT) family protein
MTSDFYCDEALSGRTPIEKIIETDNVLAFHHTRPFYPVHVVVIPKRHIGSLLTLEPKDDSLLLELIDVVRQVAAQVVRDHGACRILTNLGQYQDSKHLHWHVAFGEPLTIGNPQQ